MSKKGSTCTKLNGRQTKSIQELVCVSAFEGEGVTTADVRVNIGQMINRPETRYGTNIKDASVWLKNGPEGDGGPAVGIGCLLILLLQAKVDLHKPFSAPSILFDR